MDRPPSPPQPAATVVLEAGRRLSRSALWTLQRRFFEEAGMLAWTDGVVPHYITSNPFIARAYVEVVLGWLRDLVRTAGPTGLPGPIHVVELGAGVGRFAFHFLRRLAPALEGAALAGLEVRYVVTDFTAANVEALRSHPALRPFVASDRLDFAVFDAEHDESLRLLESGRVLAPGSHAGPIAVIANYFFDGIPQDVFRVEDGKLHEGLVTLSAPAPALDDPGLLAHVELAFTHRPLTGAPYDDPELDAILLEYQERLGRTSIVFPCAALRCLRALRELANGRLLVLSGDKGLHREQDLLGRADPTLTRHGSLSLTVNHHALARWFEAQGGHAMLVSRGGETFEIAGFLLDPQQAAHVETRRAYDQAIERLGPDDFFALKKAIEREHAGWTVREILAWLRMSEWDFNIMLGCLPTLLRLVGAAEAEHRRALRRAVHLVWDGYFPIGERRDLAFALAALLCAMDYHDDALRFYERSLRLYGPTPMTAYNMAICHHRLHRLGPAQARVDEALALDPGFEEAKALRIVLRAEATTEAQLGADV